VDKMAGRRKRGLYIANATRKKLERERFLKAIAETRGAWSDKDHPELKTAADVTQFVREMRQAYRKRDKRN